MIEILNNLPRLQFAQLPTPLQPLPKLSQQLNLDLWVKRDDLTGLAFGGNKTRKLELLTADALRQNCDTLVTTGAIQSNHCRQTAAAAAHLGLACSLVLVGEDPGESQANLLLDNLLGAQVHWTNKADQESTINALIKELERTGSNPYAIPYGGSNPLGVAAYALAFSELAEQKDDFDVIVVASSSGGTQAGLLLGAGLLGFEGEILGISIEPSKDELQEIIHQLITDTVQQFELGVLSPAVNIQVEDQFLGDGYALMGELEHKAIMRFAKQEGLLLDPVYTGRAAGGMLKLIDLGIIRQNQRVLFWHTGGTPALFAYNKQLSARS